MKKICTKLKEGFDPTLDIIIPKGKDQKMIFFCFFCFYAIFSFLFYLKYYSGFPDKEILNYDVYDWNLFFSRKNGLLPFYGGLRHPFITLIFSPFISLSILIKMLSAKFCFQIIFLSLIYNIISALSILIIYKYCNVLLKIRKREALLICILFALFAHVLLLSFIVETFQLSMLGLLIMVYLTTDNILNKKKIPLITNIILFCYITGVTVSNGAKGLIALLFQKTKLKERLKSIIFSKIICLLIIIFSFSSSVIISKYTTGDFFLRNNTKEYISSMDNVNIFHDFFSEPILFHHNYEFWGNSPEKPFLYYSVFPMIISILFYALILFALFLNIKNRSILLLLSFYLIFF